LFKRGDEKNEIQYVDEVQIIYLGAGKKFSTTHFEIKKDSNGEWV
jgi:hypothetical protein